MATTGANASGQDLEELTDRIRDFVLRDGRVSGDRIETEVELAQIFDVGRHQVRKALNTMVQHGLLSKKPRRGTVIRDFDPSVVARNLELAFQASNFRRQEYIEARIVIEQAVLPLAAKRMTPDRIAALEDSVEQMIASVGEPVKADAADRDFHMILLAASGNAILSSLGTVVAMLFKDTAYREKYWSPTTIQRLAKEHAQILDAIKNDDIEEAIALHKEHLHYQRKLNL